MCRNSTFGKNPRKIGKHLSFPGNSRSQKTKCRRAWRGPDKAQARARPGRAWPVSGRLRHFLGLPSRLYEARDVKLTGGFEVFPERSPLRRHHQKPYSGDQKLRSGTLPGRGIGGDHRHHHHRRLSINHPCFPHPCVSNSPAVG